MNGLTAWERWELATFDSESGSRSTAAGAESDSASVAQDKLERIREEARQQGYDAGYASGRANVEAEADRLASAITSLDQALAEFDQQVADELLALATEIARQVIRQEVSAFPDIVAKVVQEALAQLPHQHATILLHPDDAALVRTHTGDTLSHAGHRLLEDARLNRGDCILESGSSKLDATLATRWRRVVETLGLASPWHDKGES